MASLLKVTLRRGRSKLTAKQLGTLTGLGLKRLHQQKILLDRPEIRGMILKVQHLIDVERFDGDDSLRNSARLREARAAESRSS